MIGIWSLSWYIVAGAHTLKDVRLRLLVGTVIVLSLASGIASANVIDIENAKTGTPETQWQVSNTGSTTIQGYATAISLMAGQTVEFKVSTPSSNYRVDIYRMGYYGGDGARLVTSIQPSVSLPQIQPPCVEDVPMGLIDCGNWSTSASWSVPADAVSDVYLANFIREDAAGETGQTVFVIRDDARGADILFQTPDTTWQAYNRFGGKGLYTSPRAFKVSYNRPFTNGTRDWVLLAVYPMVRWLEANGYDVSYATGADIHRDGVEILNHRAFLSVGHDEYWSAAQRSNVEVARDADVHLAFFSGNEMFWKTRWEESIDGANTPYRTLVSYKETHADAIIDPDPVLCGEIPVSVHRKMGGVPRMNLQVHFLVLTLSAMIA